MLNEQQIALSCSLAFSGYESMNFLQKMFKIILRGALLPVFLLQFRSWSALIESLKNVVNAR